MIIYMNKNLIIFFTLILIVYTLFCQKEPENFAAAIRAAQAQQAAQQAAALAQRIAAQQAAQQAEAERQATIRCASLGTSNITIQRICKATPLNYQSEVAKNELINILQNVNTERFKEMFDANFYIKKYSLVLENDTNINNLQPLLTAIKYDVFDNKRILLLIDDILKPIINPPIPTINPLYTFVNRRGAVLNKIILILCKIKRTKNYQSDKIPNDLLYLTIMYFSLIGIAEPKLLDADNEDIIKKNSLSTYMLTQKVLLDAQKYDKILILSNPEYKKLVIIFYSVLENIIGYDNTLYKNLTIPLDYISYVFLIRNNQNF